MVSSSFRPRLSKRKFAELLNEPTGPSNGLAALLDLYRPYLLATAKARLEPALKPKAGPSDLVQETMIRAHREFSHLAERPQTESEFRGWLRNLLLERLKALRHRYYRAKKRTVLRERSLGWDSRHLIEKLEARRSASPGSRLDLKITIEELHEALQRLSPAYLQVILWRNRDGLPFAEIGDRISRSADAARMLWYRALKQLKLELRPDHVDD